MFRNIINRVKNDPLKILVVVVIIFGGILRFVGTNPGYNPYHADENMSYSSAWQMLVNHNLDPKRYDYPTLIPIINLIFFITIFIPFNLVKYLIFNYQSLSSFGDLPIFLKQILEKGDLQALFWSRYISAFFSTLSLPLVYLIAIKLYKSKLIGIVAIIILAVNYKTILNSHFALPDIYNAFFFLLTFYSILNLLEKPNYKNYMFTGITVGLSFITKFQAYSLIPFLITHVYLTIFNKDSFWIKIRNLFSGKFICSLLFIPVFFVLFNSYHLVNFDKFYQSNQYTLLKYYSQHSTVYGLAYIFYIALTPVISIASIFGLIIAFKERFFKSLILAVIPAAFLYVLMFKIGGTTYTRNYVSIIPFVAIFSAYFFNWLFQLLYWLTKNRVLSIVIITLVLGLYLKVSLQNSFTMLQSYKENWGMVNLNQWIAGNLQLLNTDSSIKPKIASHQWDFSIVLSKPISTIDKFELIPLSLGSTYFLDELQQEKADYALLGLDVVNTENSWWMPQLEKFGFQFWKEKDVYISNQATALAVNELAENTLFAAVKPWQAPDNNYLFVKIPKPLEFKKKEVISYTFDNNENLWSKIDGNFGRSKNLAFDVKNGFEKEGSLQMKAMTPFIQVVRYISPIFKVHPGYGYQVAAWVKSASNVDKKNRDGFLRIDFYQEEPKIFNESMQSIKTGLSERYFGEAAWVNLDVVTQAPFEAKFATVSFQVSSPSTTDFWIDDVSIFESLNKIQNPAMGEKYTFQNEILYPYSQGGL